MTPPALTSSQIFTDASFWRQPTTAGVHDQSATWMSWLEANVNPSFPYPRLDAGADWGIPVVYPTWRDPSFTITPRYGKPITIRIPAGAVPSTGSDHAMVGIDFSKGETWSLWHADFDGEFWTADGTARYNLVSDGLCSTWPNFGHRGIAPPVQVIQLRDLDAGRIPHALEGFFPDTAPAHISPPMCGHEPRTGVVPEGARIRIRADVTLEDLLAGDALIIAKAAKEFGVIVGDTDGSERFAMKVQPTGRVASDSLSVLTLDLWEFAAA